VVLPLFLGTLHSWLRRRGLSTPLALVLMLIFVGAIFAGFSFTLGAYMGRFTERLGFYASRLDGQHHEINHHILRSS
jgi:predicted PurR-regulated permease PerM